eukprot:TRINITY_DN4097_c0_g3_i2.p1 TRINITY_DN4097_c0_g3~~TRINITY_DN4097_c0_g3_i2.p1  ORF type:complete len:795 (+),score=215.31 TRINITY_DN4097_c0_g3_i2:88-2472(+)
MTRLTFCKCFLSRFGVIDLYIPFLVTSMVFDIPWLIWNSTNLDILFDHHCYDILHGYIWHTSFLLISLWTFIACVCARVEPKPNRHLRILFHMIYVIFFVGGIIFLLDFQQYTTSKSSICWERFGIKYSILWNAMELSVLFVVLFGCVSKKSESFNSFSKRWTTICSCLNKCRRNSNDINRVLKHVVDPLGKFLWVDSVDGSSNGRTLSQGELFLIVWLLRKHQIKQIPDILSAGKYHVLSQKDENRLLDACKYIGWAEAMYAGVLLVKTDGYTKTCWNTFFCCKDRVEHKDKRSPDIRRRLFAAHNNIPSKDVIHASKDNWNIFEHPFVIAVDRPNKTIGVVIRGTNSLMDILTDGLAQFIQPEKGELPDCAGCWVHAGMFSSGLYLARRMRELLPPIMKENPGYRLLILGHSLGAGVATTATMLLREDFPGIHGYAYGCPPVGDAEFAEAAKGHVTSICVGLDVVNRCSVASVYHLKHAFFAFQNKFAGKRLHWVYRNGNLAGDMLAEAIQERLEEHKALSSHITSARDFREHTGLQRLNTLNDEEIQADLKKIKEMKEEERRNKLIHKVPTYIKSKIKLPRIPLPSRSQSVGNKEDLEEYGKSDNSTETSANPYGYQPPKLVVSKSSQSESRLQRENSMGVTQSSDTPKDALTHIIRKRIQMNQKQQEEGESRVFKQLEALKDADESIKPEYFLRLSLPGEIFHVCDVREKVENGTGKRKKKKHKAVYARKASPSDFSDILWCARAVKHHMPWKYTHTLRRYMAKVEGGRDLIKTRIHNECELNIGGYANF